MKERAIIAEPAARRKHPATIVTSTITSAPATLLTSRTTKRAMPPVVRIEIPRPKRRMPKPSVVLFAEGIKGKSGRCYFNLSRDSSPTAPT